MYKNNNDIKLITDTLLNESITLKKTAIKNWWFKTDLQKYNFFQTLSGSLKKREIFCLIPVLLLIKQNLNNNVVSL